MQCMRLMSVVFLVLSWAVYVHAAEPMSLVEAQIALADKQDAALERARLEKIAMHPKPAHRIEVEAGVRWQQGTALELVYDGPFLLSELEWDIQDLLFVGVTVRVPLWRQLFLVASYWEAMNEGNGGMTDYDFFLPGVWTDFSEGPVEVNEANQFDIHLDWAVFRLKQSQFHVLGGYRRMYWDWSQYGGNFIYSEEGFRDASGSFPDDENGINYEQTFEIPYVGLGLTSHWRGVGLRSYMHFSPFASAEGYDEHVLRDLHFEDTFDDVTYMAAGVSAAYRLGQHWYVSGALDWHNIPEKRGDGRIIDIIDGYEELDPSGAGIGNRAYSLSLSVGATF